MDRPMILQFSKTFDAPSDKISGGNVQYVIKFWVKFAEFSRNKMVAMWQY